MLIIQFSRVFNVDYRHKHIWNRCKLPSADLKSGRGNMGETEAAYPWQLPCHVTCYGHVTCCGHVTYLQSLQTLPIKTPCLVHKSHAPTTNLAWNLPPKITYSIYYIQNQATSPCEASCILAQVHLSVYYLPSSCSGWSYMHYNYINWLFEAGHFISRRKGMLFVKNILAQTFLKNIYPGWDGN